MERQHGSRIVSFLVVVLASLPALAGGTIAGKVVDRAGEPKQGVTVIIRPKDDPKLRTYRSKTNAKGLYVVAADNGDYHIGVEAGDLELERITIHAEDSKRKPVFDWSGRVTPTQPPIVIGMSSQYKIDLDLVLADRAVLRKERSDGLLALIGKALEEKDQTRATALVDDFMAQSPGDPMGLMLRGYLSSEQGRFESAEADLKDALAKQPELADARYHLGLVYRKSDRLEDALGAFRAVSEGNTTDDLRGKAWLNVGELERGAGRADQAIEAFQRAAEVDPSLVSAIGPELAALYTDRGNTEMAESWLTKLESTGGSDSNVRFNLAVTHFNRKEWDAAIAGFRRVLAADPSFAEAHRGLGFALQAKGDGVGAVESLRKYLELRPDAPDSEEIKMVIKALGRA